jgi:hypothetical protein
MEKATPRSDRLRQHSDHGEILLDEHDVGFPARPSHWAWAGTVKRPRKIGMLAVIAFNIGFLSRQTGRAGSSGHISLSHGKEGKPAGQALIQIKQTLRPSLMGIKAVKKGFAEG